LGTFFLANSVAIVRNRIVLCYVAMDGRAHGA